MEPLLPRAVPEPARVSGGVASKPIQHDREINGCIALFFHLEIESHACGTKPLFDGPSEALRRAWNLSYLRKSR